MSSSTAEILNKGSDKRDGQEDTIPTIDESAWGWYNNQMSLGGTRPRNWLPLAVAYEVSQALGRSLSQDDLQFFIRKDGGPVQCLGCGKMFQPVKRVVINDELLNVLQEEGIGALLTGHEVRWMGSFLVKVTGSGPVMLSFCGGLFYYKPNLPGEIRPEQFEVNRGTCLGMAYLNKENSNREGKPYPARCWSDAQATIDEIVMNYEAKKAQIRQERRDRRLGGIQDAFSRAEQLARSSRIGH